MRVIVAIGTDLVEVARLQARLMRLPALAARLFTARERELCAHRAESLAARLAAKEAVLKALGSALAAASLGAVAANPAAAPSGASVMGLPAGLPRAIPTEPHSWRLTDIEVSTAPGCAPLLQLHGAVAQLAADLGIRRWHLSLAHDGGAALAYVVAED
ncbi:Holo-[acyl-carrier-protein] synthase [Actinomyces bovis]|uniref:Holo-[acyl-carrier-protein] synthase n=1 Tax=Actinomyces bovis TaxID=1658 RepID=A0ABY1VN31_9ACTO|nr:Holo-[acyl-carrier-protein] synthase [Actinomyces bovis]VEG54987.1 Holo-[acyl-carrier-protein] synthase [Actinomyces israelii]